MDLSAIIAAVISTWPQAAPYLALVPVAQVLLSALANLPRLWGVTHETVWSRVCTALATMHVIPGPTTAVQKAAVVAARADQPKIPPPGGAADAGFLTLMAIVLGSMLLFSGTSCAALQKTAEQVPVDKVCVTIDPALVTKEGLVCTELCITKDPPGAEWTCTRAQP